MDAAERAFIENLLQTHRSHLQVLEQQAATFGIMAPPYVVTQVAEYRQKIAELEARLYPSVVAAATRPEPPAHPWRRVLHRQPLHRPHPPPPRPPLSRRPLASGAGPSKPR